MSSEAVVILAAGCDGAPSAPEREREREKEREGKGEE